MAAYPALRIDRDALMAYCGPACLGGISAKFDCLAPRVFSKAKTLQRFGTIEKMSALLKDEDRAAVRMVLNDLIVATCLVPVEGALVLSLSVFTM